ncbi:MAG: zinc ABC transporter substrate-binding protein [Armatimonadetes bacterium]|nr:zinc ABC transporter substrate-binding protein [Armatimonadota bacterium]
MKRLVICAAVAASIGLTVGGCRRAPESRADKRVLCSVFPVWLIARNVANGRDGVRVELLLPAGLGCPHEYLVTPQDVRRIEQADVLIVNGLGFDDFATERYREAKPDRPVITATSGIVEGDDGETNPHLFASPRLAARMAEVIARELGSRDPEGRDLYMRNAAAYGKRLNALADEIRAVVESLPNKRIIGQHDVLDWFAKDAGLEIAGVAHAHAGHDPSASEVMEMVRLARREGVGAVMTEPQYPPGLGRTIAREAGIRSGTLDPAASGPDDAPLDHYERAMRGNIEALREALGGTGR